MLSKKSLKGNIDVSLNAIANIAGNAATECYGVFGLASKSAIRDGIDELLEAENYIQGVKVKDTKAGIDIDMYICVAYGIKITEVVNEVQKRVRYVLRKSLNINTHAVNIYVLKVKDIS